MKKVLLVAAFLVLAVPASAARLPMVASQDWWPLWSPQGTEIAFTRIAGSSMTLDVVDARYDRIRSIGSNRGQLSPTWSSDGRLAFSLGGQIYTAAASGANRQRLTSVGHSYAPAWRPESSEVAYLTTQGAQNTDLWVADSLWARNAIGKPAWSPDGEALAFQRDDGIYVATGPGVERKLVSVVSPGQPAWSPDGLWVAYAAARRMWTVRTDGTASPKAVSPVLSDLSAPSWSRQSDAVVFTVRGALELSFIDGRSSALLSTAGVGASFAPKGDFVAFSGPRPACPGHDAIRLYFDNTHNGPLTGTCEIRGTPGNDIVDGTGATGDIILAGAGNDRIHANDGHTDRVDCGPGRDTVWADRTDKLSSCETVHR